MGFEDSDVANPNEVASAVWNCREASNTGYTGIASSVDSGLETHVF
jgi:hypothetical protein